MITSIELNKVWAIIQSRTIKLPNGCHVLTTRANSDYSGIWFNKNNYKAARVACALFKGLDYNDPESHACHEVSCDNKLCFNPEHLYNGTRTSNAIDRYIINRPGRQTVCKSCSKPISKNRVISMALCKNCYRIYQQNKRKTVVSNGY
jgi:hypothetical protein